MGRFKTIYNILRNEYKGVELESLKIPTKQRLTHLSVTTAVIIDDIFTEHFKVL